jgi:hypothetical protein
MRALVLPLAALVAVAACAPSPTGPGTRASTTPAAQRALTVGSIKGTVVAPAGYKAGDKAPATAVDAAKKYDLLAKGEAVADVEVWVGSPKSERFKGPTIGKTNAKGQFTIKNVPRDLNFVVFASVVDAKGRAQTAGSSQQAEAPPPYCAVMPSQKLEQRPIEISYASTLVVQDLLADIGNQLGKIDFVAYGKAVAAVDAKLDFDNLPNLADPKAIDGFLATVQVDGKAVTQSLDAIKSQIKATGVSAQDVQAVLNGLPQINISGSGSVSQDGETVAAGEGETTLTVPQGIDLSGILGPDPTPAPAATAEPTASPAAN